MSSEVPGAPHISGRCNVRNLERAHSTARTLSLTRTLSPTLTCQVCKVQKKGRCGTATASVKCEKLVANGGIPPIGPKSLTGNKRKQSEIPDRNLSRKGVVLVRSEQAASGA